MFYKDIERDIKGVIKIGQEDDYNVRQELHTIFYVRHLFYMESTHYLFQIPPPAYIRPSSSRE